MFAMSLLACSSDRGTEDPMVAHAYDNVLTWSELRRMVPVDASTEDSTAMANDIITSWLRKEVLLHHAELNLSEEDLDFEERLRNYRNSLVIYAFEDAIVREKLDTLVDRQQLELHLQEHAEDFRLKEDLVRVKWSKVRSSEVDRLRRARKWFESDDPEDLHELELWMAEQGVSSTDPQGQWMSRERLDMELPFNGLGVKAGQRVVVSDSVDHYFVEVMDVRPMDSLAPLELVHQDIRAIVLNQRKLALVQGMHDDLFEKALTNGEIGTP